MIDKINETKDNIRDLITLLNNYLQSNSKIIKSNLIKNTIDKLIRIDQIIYVQQNNLAIFTNNKIINYLYKINNIYHKLNIELNNTKNKNDSIEQFHNLFFDIILEINDIIDILIPYLAETNSDKEVFFNSTDFYKNKIKSIDEEKKKLKELVYELENQTNQSIEIKKQLEFLQAELENATHLIEFYKKELELRDKQEDAIKEWERKIETTFIRLKMPLNGIKNERRKLNWMFGIYGMLIISIIALLIALEIIAYSKIYNAIAFPNFKNYIILFIPVPIAGGLLWAFICQLNRAQRQMVITSRYIYEIEYIEGLLLSINSLSANIDDAVKRINFALDKMIDNHLSTRGENLFTEDSILKEEKKDKMPYEVFLKILGEIKEIAKKV